MADADLNVKIDENDYRQALSDLSIEYRNLEGALHQLQTQREKLENNFISKNLTPGLINMIKNKEQEVQKSMDNVQLQITKIENRLTSLSNSETTISGKISEAAESHSKAFG